VELFELVLTFEGPVARGPVGDDRLMVGATKVDILPHIKIITKD
jgi:hypothetical protein